MFNPPFLFPIGTCDDVPDPCEDGVKYPDRSDCHYYYLCKNKQLQNRTKCELPQGECQHSGVACAFDVDKRECVHPDGDLNCKDICRTSTTGTEGTSVNSKQSSGLVTSALTIEVTKSSNTRNINTVSSSQERETSEIVSNPDPSKVTSSSSTSSLNPVSSPQEIRTSEIVTNINSSKVTSSLGTSSLNPVSSSREIETSEQPTQMVTSPVSTTLTSSINSSFSFTSVSSIQENETSERSTVSVTDPVSKEVTSFGPSKSNSVSYSQDRKTSGQPTTGILTTLISTKQKGSFITSSFTSVSSPQGNTFENPDWSSQSTQNETTTSLLTETYSKHIPKITRSTNFTSTSSLGTAFVSSELSTDSTQNYLKTSTISHDVSTKYRTEESSTQLTKHNTNDIVTDLRSSKSTKLFSRFHSVVFSSTESSVTHPESTETEMSSSPSTDVFSQLNTVQNSTESYTNNSARVSLPDSSTFTTETSVSRTSSLQAVTSKTEYPKDSSTKHDRTIEDDHTNITSVSLFSTINPSRLTGGASRSTTGSVKNVASTKETLTSDTISINSVHSTMKPVIQITTQYSMSTFDNPHVKSTATQQNHTATDNSRRDTIGRTTKMAIVSSTNGGLRTSSSTDQLVTSNNTTTYQKETTTIQQSPSIISTGNSNISQSTQSSTNAIFDSSHSTIDISIPSQMKTEESVTEAGSTVMREMTAERSTTEPSHSSDVASKYNQTDAYVTNPLVSHSTTGEKLSSTVNVPLETTDEIGDLGTRSTIISTVKSSCVTSGVTSFEVPTFQPLKGRCCYQITFRC